MRSALYAATCVALDLAALVAIGVCYAICLIADGIDWLRKRFAR